MNKNNLAVHLNSAFLYTFSNKGGFIIGVGHIFRMRWIE